MTNVLQGPGAGESITTADGSSLYGEDAGTAITSGNNNTAVGRRALASMSNNSNAVAVGAYAAENNTAGGIIAVGMRALRNCTTGWINLGVGIEAGYNLTTAGGVTIVGMGAGYNITSGWNSCIFGHDAGKTISSQANLCAFGKNAAYGVYGPDNAVFGHAAMGTSTTRPSARNSYFGAYAGSNANGDNSVGIGFEAGLNGGNGSVYVGYQAGKGSDANNRLFISNTDTLYPLIGGDFSAKTVSLAGGTASITASAFIQGSDRRLKKNIKPLKTSGRIDDLKPVTFAWKDGDRADTGFIAQDVQNVIPEAVFEGDRLGINPMPIIAELVNEVKALRKRVAKLEAH